MLNKICPTKAKLLLGLFFLINPIVKRSEPTTMIDKDIHSERILILDFGSQYTQLIARRVREAGVYSEIMPWDVDEQAIKDFNANGIILSGGPETVTIDDAPVIPAVVFELNNPLLGICYGMQAMATQLGGSVESSDHCEFGYARISIEGQSTLLAKLDKQLDVWMSHGDKVTRLPEGFELMAQTDSAPIAGMYHAEKNYYAVQFHPEVTHTDRGQEIIRAFTHDICGCHGDWTIANIIDAQVKAVREQVGNEQVILGLSGGVDSSVVAALLHKAIGDQFNLCLC